MLNNKHAKVLFPILLACAPPAAAWAQSVPALQDSSVTGYGSTVTINRLPISVSGGGYAFKDVTITLTTTDNQGTLSSSAAVTQAASIPLKTSNIVAGQYGLSTDPGNYQITITGPASIGNGGEASWTVVKASGYQACGVPSNFYTGSLKENPMYARLKAAKIISTQYSYGVIDTGTSCGSPFAAGALIGVSQVGNEVEIATFTNNGQDQSTPVTSEIFNLIQ